MRRLCEHSLRSETAYPATNQQDSAAVLHGDLHVRVEVDEQAPERQKEKAPQGSQHSDYSRTPWSLEGLGKAGEGRVHSAFYEFVLLGTGGTVGKALTGLQIDYFDGMNKGF